MAPLPVITNVFRVAIKHFVAASGEHTVNVIHLRSSVGTLASLQAALDAHGTAAMWGELNSSYASTSITLTKLDGTSASVTYTPATPANWAGGASGEEIPEAAAGLTLNTAIRGRSYRGRIYVGPVTEAQCSGGNLLSAGVTAHTAAWNTFLADMAAVGWDLVVASYLHATAQNVTLVVGRLGIRTQRKRLLRVRS